MQSFGCTEKTAHCSHVSVLYGEKAMSPKFDDMTVRVLYYTF